MQKNILILITVSLLSFGVTFLTAKELIPEKYGGWAEIGRWDRFMYWEGLASCVKK